ncbi:hypothetical protein CO051_06235 [Candidatus Roizmanbacteria bacterium CG_4_9_14_0_2_um_filter_39_13]|uniref:Uncharacterized protein n=1 Tax=Candidatus Roizmanbacteria bacterium CG_4_9_14_0_2_um_filter_39_13 TaxID=1974839 RepID=A0A2M8EWU8_9BACT|nr:MAG: hypothetical protein COY15_01735 [Candidatus Roizmanbacteria bacterium CG_4_10_14_0_2_um_filter_39_12]PJC30341.1 MAG: hypothetical protein CO051_06235 [Candidatus Roizmanbacteria bacterium CG_4_9_14_0_2_um_filter_39_13]
MEEETPHNKSSITSTQEWKIAAQFFGLDPTNPNGITGSEMLDIAENESRFAEKIGNSQQKIARPVVEEIVGLTAKNDPRAQEMIAKLRRQYAEGSGTYAGGALTALQALGIIDELI